MPNSLNIETLTNQQLPSPRALKKLLPATPAHLNFIDDSRQQIASILDGKDSRLLLIVGPCSIHDIAAAKEYAIKLRELSEKLSDYFFIVMRTYFEKPRTASGWKGLLQDPHLNDSADIATGLHWSRKLLLFLADIGMPAATEFLDPATSHYLVDLVTWACIGARTSESQIHRQCASGLPMPVAFKNSTSGNIDIAINGVLTASNPHSFLGINESGNIDVTHTRGNPYAHIALRGGAAKPNYDAESIAYAIERLEKTLLPQRLIIDCSHDNSSRDYNQQIPVFKSVFQQYMQGNTAIKGLALESNLQAGRQHLSNDISRLHYGVSITDSCLDWPATEELLYWGKATLEQNNFSARMEKKCIESNTFAQL